MECALEWVRDCPLRCEVVYATPRRKAVRTVSWSELTALSEATPSFALMDVQGPVIVTYVYQLVDGEVSATCVA